MARYAVLITEDSGECLSKRDPLSGSYEFTFLNRYARFLEDCDAHAAVFEKFDDAVSAVSDELERLGIGVDSQESAIKKLKRNGIVNTGYDRGSSHFLLLIEVLNLVPYEDAMAIRKQFEE